MTNNMKTLKTTLLAAAAALPLLAGPLSAAYEDVGVSARATGMSNAFTAVADDVYTIHYNPAGLATLTRPEFATSYSKLLMGLSDNSNLQNSFLAYEHPLKDGRWGTAGLAWNYFTLDNLYRESSLYMSYGRALAEESMPGKLYGGVSFKYLNRSLGSTPGATAAVGPTGIVGGADPVLQSASKSNIDMDWGLLYRPIPRWTLGLMVEHFLQPNVAFASNDTDTLGRNIKLGGSYKTPFSTLSADLDFVKAPDGNTDKQLALAAEKWLPTLVHGSFAVRGSLAAGSRSYRQLAMGVSYRIHKMQFDYGFSIPLGGLSGTSGTHRLGLTFRFGRAAASQPTMADAITENLNDLAAVGTPEFKYQMEDLALFKRTAIDELLRQAKVDVSDGKFADALEKLDQASSLKPGDPRIEASRERLKVIAGVYPQLRDFSTDPAQAAIYEGALDFLIGKDKDALKKITYAQSLAPSSEKPEALLEGIEKRSGTARAQAPSPAQTPKESTAAGAEKIVAGNTALLEVAMREREYDKVLKLAAQILELDPANALAYKRMGSAYYALHKNTEALKALRSAYKLESDPDEKKRIRGYVDALAAVIEQKTQAAQAARAETPKATKSPQDLERLYEAGVDLYAQGKLAEAAAMFKKILELEPSNISAQRALDRVQTELIQGGRH